jgi:hypothetical protein
MVRPSCKCTPTTCFIHLLRGCLLANFHVKVVKVGTVKHELRCFFAAVKTCNCDYTCKCDYAVYIQFHVPTSQLRAAKWVNSGWQNRPYCSDLWSPAASPCNSTSAALCGRNPSRRCVFFPISGRFPRSAPADRRANRSVWDFLDECSISKSIIPRSEHLVLDFDLKN